MDKKELVRFLIENFGVEGSKWLDLSGLDFGDYLVDISHLKTTSSLFQGSQVVGRDLAQSHQKVNRVLFQHKQTVGRDLYQNEQDVKGKIWNAEDFPFITEEDIEYSNLREGDKEFEFVKQMLKRNKAMKPKRFKAVSFCPNCAHTVDNHYCSDCGQRLDWSEDNE